MMKSKHRHGPGCHGVIIRGAWDGPLFWHCLDGELRNRWDEDAQPKRHALAEQYMDLYRYAVMGGGE